MTSFTLIGSYFGPVVARDWRATLGGAIRLIGGIGVILP